MCLAVPGELLAVTTSGTLPTGRVSFGGIVKQICLAYTPDASPGDYVLVHAGFSISNIDKAEAECLINTYSGGALVDDKP